MAASRKTSSKSHICDVAIAGGGPAGLTLALALARRGYEVGVVDGAPAPKAGKVNDSRAFFIAYGCWRIFRSLALDTELSKQAEPVTSIEAKGKIGGVSFLAEECDGEPVLGYMVEAAHLLPALHEAVKAEQGIRLVSGAKIEAVSFGDPLAVLSYAGGEMHAPLIVACDGAKSVVRGGSGLRFEGWQYDAKVISATVQLQADHKGSARQVFLPGGPLAVLPLKGNRANLIWTERAAVADALMALDDAGFEAELAKKAGDFVPGAKLAGARHAFPVGLFVAEAFHAQRLALAGDAAHVIHPLGGQGLNLGLKDIAALVDVIDEAGHAGLDIGAASALAPYTSWRRADVAGTAAAMEAFARAFSAPLPVRLAAGAVMGAVGALGPARKLFAKEAGGDLGELPSLMART
ncbi:MAG TPA: FAD-dependent monooxygenase [Hyphomonadaceae bacterium]|nr:FAD-dependent monooxygenase [Hyphomonadaceae bacterium]